MEELSKENVLQNEALRNTSEFKYAGFWVRAVAVLIDGIILGVIGFIISLIAISTKVTSLIYTYYLINIIYLIYFEANGGTPGKKALNLRIINYSGENIGYPNAALRYIGKIISGLLFGFGYIMAAFDNKKQALHDKIVKTYVIYNK